MKYIYTHLAYVYELPIINCSFVSYCSLSGLASCLHSGKSFFKQATVIARPAFSCVNGFTTPSLIGIKCIGQLITRMILCKLSSLPMGTKGW